MGQTNSAHEIAEHDNIEDVAVAGLKLAREALEAWKASVSRSVRPAFGALLTALGNWEEEILASPSRTPTAR